ncbi:hypothetical protein BTJ39_19115 [Izhakiella australiensis]|uniref:HNH nuclease domain-containing protein n=1 Tax=Izhakiella australiensis TaxID=1926881 RepID=A0A1S8YG91_9GAMM|nr:HNH endonuclease [Izhakiella australiensis]OON38079.1 hypothetical protein BTJ39_19115 [Izhakiella australiensis]
MRAFLDYSFNHNPFDISGNKNIKGFSSAEREHFIHRLPIFKLDDVAFFKCPYCNEDIHPRAAHVDHIIPYAVYARYKVLTENEKSVKKILEDAETDENNFILCCQSCNTKKSDTLNRALIITGQDHTRNTPAEDKFIRSAKIIDEINHTMPPHQSMYCKIGHYWSGGRDYTTQGDIMDFLTSQRLHFKSYEDKRPLYPLEAVSWLAEFVSVKVNIDYTYSLRVSTRSYKYDDRDSLYDITMLADSAPEIHSQMIENVALKVNFPSQSRLKRLIETEQEIQKRDKRISTDGEIPLSGMALRIHLGEQQVMSEPQKGYLALGCYYCLGIYPESAFHLDHIKPSSLNEVQYHDGNNLLAVCLGCNTKKQHKKLSLRLLEELIEERKSWSKYLIGIESAQNLGFSSQISADEYAAYGQVKVLHHHFSGTDLSYLDKVIPKLDEWMEAIRNGRQATAVSFTYRPPTIEIEDPDDQTT